MELYARIFILCLLCIVRASETSPKEIAEFRGEPLTYVDDLLRIPTRKTDELDGQSTETPRDKRALGLLLSGLAQIFGYTVTPVQFASLPNPKPAAMPSSPKTNVKQQTASSRPANTTVPKQRETIRFTGVLNLGNNSNILEHLQQYEQIFHGRRSNATTTMMTTSRPSVIPAEISLNPETSSPTRPPLLAPFFVKIPLPIAPELLPTMPIEELELAYPTPPVSITVDLNENTETPTRKEQEMIYRSKEDTERYTVEEKDIYDEKDVRKPTNKYNQQLFVDEPKWDKQQNDRQNELRRKQEERVRKLQQREKERNLEKAARYNEKEMKERYKNREKEIAGRNREHASRHEPTKERKPARGSDEEDDGSAERKYASEENLSDESSRQPSNEKEQSEDYDDDSNKQFNRDEQSEDLNKYVRVGYNQQLPIGDYFHEGNPEVIRDSYGEVLNNKRLLEDDRIAGYISMFKHPYVQGDAYDSQRAQPEEDTSREEDEKETSAEDGYDDEHLNRLQKLREEYALPENKYEEYDLNDESEADRDDRGSEGVQNRTIASSRRPRPGRVRDKEEVDLARYLPLVVPVRYIDANEKAEQATTRQLSYKEADKSADSRFSEDNVDPVRTVVTENSAPQIGPPERPRQLHEGEHKELQVWPPPPPPPAFDYVFDNTEPANTVVPPNPRTYAPDYYQHVVKGVAAQDANDKSSSEQPSGYLVVVGNPTYPYRYPYNIYYFSNEAVNPRAPTPHPRDPVYVPQQSAGQVSQVVRAKPNITEHNPSETTISPRNHYYQPQQIPASDLDRYRYIFGERTGQVKEPFDIEIRSQIPNVENWSNRMQPRRPQPPSNTAEVPRPIFTRLQDIASSKWNAQNGPSQQRKDDEEATTPQSISRSKPFDDPQSAHDFFGFSKDDYNFGSESGDATQVAEENGKTAEKSDVFAVAEPAAYHPDDESIAKHVDEPENDPENAKVREYRNKVGRP